MSEGESHVEVDVETGEMRETHPVPNTFGMSYSVVTAAEYLAEVVQKSHGTKNGQTALFWHLMSIVSRHAKANAPRA